MRPWRTSQRGRSLAQLDDDEARLQLHPASAAEYHNAQISDYRLPARDFSCKPPLRLSLLARADCQRCGTAGFGFWNHAFVPGERGLRLPQALWFFFAGPANDMALAKGVPGLGWKAATFDPRKPLFFAMLPFAPLGFLLMRQRRLYDRLWPLGQRAIGVHEAALDPELLADYHEYAIDWNETGAVFSVDGEPVLTAPGAPAGPLGFIAWIDNQYAIVKPQGNFRHGLVDVPRAQTLSLREVSLRRPG